MTVKELVDKILEDKIVTKQEYVQLREFINADGQVTEEESEQVARLLEMIRNREVEMEK